MKQRNSVDRQNFIYSSRNLFLGQRAPEGDIQIKSNSAKSPTLLWYMVIVIVIVMVVGGGGELVHNGGGGALYWCNRYNTMQCNATRFSCFGESF